MNTTYHFNSAQEVSNEIVDAIKKTYHSKAITITIHEEENDELSDTLKAILDDRLQEDETTYLTASESVEKLKTKYGL